jgi:hypothetical protein
MKVHEYREMMKYLTRPDVSKIEIPMPAPKAPVEPQEMSNEEHAAHLNAQIEQGYATGGRVEYADGTPFDYNALSNEGRVQVAQKRVIDYVKKFEKENGRLPSQQEVRYKGGFDFQTVKKAIQLKNIEVLPLNQTKGEFTKIPVHKDLRTLDQSKIIQDAFKSGEPPSLNDVKKVLKIKDPTTAANRITQLASIYSGESDVEGIKPKFKESAKTILKNNTYDSQIRTISEKAIAKSVGERRTPASIRTTTQRDVIPNVKGYSIDEPAGITSSVRNKTTPYGVFSQIIDTDINKGDKYAFDSIKSKKEVVLQNAIESGDKTKINEALKDYNKAVSKYESILNEDVKPGEKKIKLFKASLDSPENTIKNFDNLPKKYQEAFTKNFNENGFSYEVPKDIKTIYKIGEDLKDPKIAEQVAKRAAQGQSRIYSFPANLSEAPLLNRVGSLAKGYWNLSGGVFNPALGAVLNSEELQEKGLSEGEAATYGAFKAVLQDAPNFAIGVTKAIGNKILPSPVQQLFSDGEEKGFFETALNDKTVDISKMPFFGSDWYKDRFVSGKQEVERKIDRDLRKEYAKQLLRRNPYPPVTDFGPVEGPQDYITPEQDKEIKEYMLNKSLQQDPELRKKYEQDKPAIDFGFKKEAEFKTGGRVGYKDGSDDDLEIPTIKNEDEYFGKKAKDVPEKGLEGLRVGFMDVKKRPDVILNKSEEEGGGATGGIRELKQLLLNNMQQLNPMIGYGGENYNAYISKGINPYGDKSLRYGAAYTPEGDKGTFTIDKGTGSIGAGYHYNDDNLTLGIGALKDKLSGEKSIMLRGNYAFATGGRASFQTGGSTNFLKMLRNISDSVRELKNSTHILGYTAKSEGIAKAAEEALAPYAGGFKGNKHETLLQKIQNAKEHLPKEYHGVLDEMKSYADKHAYDAVDDMAKALDKTIDPNLKFENLSKKMFPMEDPLNDAFIITDPEKGHMTGRYTHSFRIDPETGRGTVETFDTFDSKTRTFLKKENWKPVGVESLEKGKEGLN